jgi:hypothetical protein
MASPTFTGDNEALTPAAYTHRPTPWPTCVLIFVIICISNKAQLADKGWQTPTMGVFGCSTAVRAAAAQRQRKETRIALGRGYKGIRLTTVSGPPPLR